MSTKQTKEQSFTDSKIFLVQTGDKVTKGSKTGQIIQTYNNNKATVLWDDGTFKNEDLEGLEKVQESLCTRYLRSEKRI